MKNQKNLKLSLSFFIIASSALSSIAYAQEFTRDHQKQCLSRCSALLKDPRANAQIAGIKLIALLGSLDAALEKETDPEKRKDLERKKAEALEKYEEKVEKVCEDICDMNGKVS